ncbi:non-hemolytic phospholipase C precursor [Ramaria rubella]|nr:non-hemolytic phospholipase C precursor [Ramaria rubella]
MQENRAFDHYYGSMAGVRGFADPNVHITQNGRPAWFQLVDATLSNVTDALLPFYINAAGGNLSEATQCMVAGSNGWTANHNAFAFGDNNLWAIKNTPFSWGHFKRQDIPTHFALAEGWTIADMYSQSVVASTIPNRAFWASGSVNVPGGPQSLDEGGVTIDNNEVPGCEATNLNCFPLLWKTFPEFMEEAGVTWQVYQDTDNFGDNPLAWFEQFQNAPNGSSLAERGLSFVGLQSFYDAAAAGTLPQVSYIIGPMELSEHPPWSPRDGGWLQQQVANAVINSPKYDSTVLIVSYDETGGWGDHVLPITAPANTPGEWMTNPFNTSETVFAGPGFRLPFYVISPWTRGGHVFTAHSDHSSQIMFLEKWLASKGKTVVTDQLNLWRRDHMSDLTQMFDFAHPDLTIPHLPVPTPPLMGANGQFLGDSVCQETFPNPQPPVPFGEQTRENSLSIETGFKSVRGALTEGRFLIFESNNRALTLAANGEGLSVGAAVPSHDVPSHRFVLHATADPPATVFTLQFAGSTKGGFVGPQNTFTTSSSHATVFNITDLGFGKGYTIQETPGGKFLAISQNGQDVEIGRQATQFSIFSVTKSTDSGQGF